MELQLFTTQDGRPLDWEVFLQHPLGQLYQTLPLQKYAESIPERSSKVGRKAWFTPMGGLGLQVLKHYYGVSDKKLIELLNFNKMMQYLCGINLSCGEVIRDDDVVSRWRAYWGHLLSKPQFLKDLQSANVKQWQQGMENTESNLSDATCYESYVRYPTDVKLLWECLQYLYPQMKVMCKYIGIPMFRSKYKEQEKKYLAYQRNRKKSHKQTRRVCKRLLYLLGKYLQILPSLIGGVKAKESVALAKCPLKNNLFPRLSIIKKVYHQQQLHYDFPKTQIKDRIVSLAKPYLRPIVRGKEIKRVEFGMKVHEMQVNGINFIEYWDFNAFHEGIRMKKTIWKHQYLFRKQCKLFGGDKIYGTNKNRRYCSQHEIQTCFVPKGKQPKNKTVCKQKRLLRQLIGKERATRLEGSFGNKKNHYLLGRIKAKNFYTEMAWIFFGNLTTNAVAMAKRTKPPP